MSTARGGLAPWPFPRWIAHRGAGKLAPENTLAAFRLGAAYGYRAFECDVKLSADEVPFLLHDATLARTTDGGEGRGGDRPWSDLARLDAGSWHSRSHAGEPPASLESVARFARANSFDINLEIKPTPGLEARTGEVVAAAVQRLWAGLPPPLFSSFMPPSLKAAQAVAPEVPRALLLDTLWDGWERVAEQLGCIAVVTHHPLMDAALVKQLHGMGCRAVCYTVNEPADAQLLWDAGVDALITDAVDRFSPAEPATR